jgi:ABC-type Fe3+/spermidine/putrescine transport system ATPase subunit
MSELPNSLNNLKAASLKILGLHKSYGGVKVLENLSLDVPGGTTFALLGPSGCGKTTTLSIIAGITASDKGQILLGEADISGVPTHRRDIGVVFQGYALFPHMTVEENIGFGLKNRNMTKVEVKERIDWALQLGRLQGLEKRHPNQLSGGQQQRTALVRSLVTRPKVMLLDEPLSNLDASLREEMRFELKRIQIETGVTTVLVTHDQVEAMELAQVIGVMDKGKLLQIGNAKDLYNSPENQFVASFLGFINYIEGTLSPENSQSMVCDLGSFRFSVDVSKIPDEAKKSGKILVGIRPETIRCSGSKLSSSSIRVSAKVQDLTFFGNRLEAHVNLLTSNMSEPSIRITNIRPEEWQQAISDKSTDTEQIVTIDFDPSSFQFFSVQSVTSASE